VLILLTGKQGFTLIEILISVVLIGIIVSFTVPSFNQLLVSITGDTTGRQLTSNLEKIKTQAVIKDKPQQVKIKGDNLVYTSSSGEKLEFGSGIKDLKLADGETKITFFPDGTSSGGKLLVTTTSEIKLVVKIEQVTGEIRLEEAE